MRKRIICLSMVLAMVFGLCACGGSGKYKVVKSLGSQEYSIGFRNGDSTYHYIDKALRELSYEGVIDDLGTQWFGSSRAVDFPSKKDALDELGYIEERTFIIGVDLDFMKIGNNMIVACANGTAVVIEKRTDYIKMALQKLQSRLFTANVFLLFRIPQSWPPARRKPALRRFDDCREGTYRFLTDLCRRP